MRKMIEILVKNNIMPIQHKKKQKKKQHAYKINNKKKKF